MGQVVSSIVVAFSSPEPVKKNEALFCSLEQTEQSCILQNYVEKDMCCEYNSEKDLQTNNIICIPAEPI